MSEEKWDLKRVGDSIHHANRATEERMRRQADEIGTPGRARIGDLAICNCWPEPWMWTICYVTRVDEDGLPTHMRDGAGARYSDTSPGAIRLPEYTCLVRREVLDVPARVIAEENADSRIFGVTEAVGAYERAVAHHVKDVA